MEGGGARKLEMAPEAIMNGLWDKKGERCAVNIPDTLLLCENEVRWLYTNQKGVVVKKKKPPEKDVITQHFLQAALANPHNGTQRVAIVQQKGGGSRMLNVSSFQQYLTTFPNGDNLMSALQCYVQSSGHAGTVYRNCYRVVNDKGKVLTSTSTYTTITPDQKDEAIIYVNSQGHERPLVKFTANRVCQALDAVTKNVVRHLERNLRVCITDVSFDYAVDDDLSTWLLWCSGPADALQGIVDLRDAKEVPLEQTFGRTSWLGTELGKEDRPCRSLSPPKDHPSRLGRRGSGGSGPLGQVEAACKAVEQSMGERMGKDQQALSQDEQRKKMEECPPMAAKIVVPLVHAKARKKKQSGSGEFPTPFRCHGDFCKVVSVDPESLGGIEPPTGTDLDQDYPELTEIARRILTRKELALLARTGNLRQVLAALTIAGLPVDATVSFKSIAMARQEKRLPTAEDTKSSGPKAGDRKVTRETKNRINYRNWPVLAGEKEGGTVNYYKQVLVCQRCWHAYNLLDKTRAVLEADQHALAEASRKAAMPELLDPEDQKHYTMINNDQTDNSSQAPGSQPPPPANGKDEVNSNEEGLKPGPSTAPRQGQGRKRSWKNRLEGDKDLQALDAHGLKKSIEGFEKLDGYLRGRTSVQAKKARATKGALEHTDTIREAKKKFQEDSQAAAEKGRGLYQAKVLIGAERSSSSSAGSGGGNDWVDQTRSILEREKYLVTVEANRFRVVDLALGGTFDALLLDRDLPEADVFQLTCAIRDGEKLRKKLKKEQKDATVSQIDHPPPQKMIPIVVVSNKTTPEDLRQYMESGMDGCVSKPLKEEASLLNTMALAVPKHLTATEEPMDKIPSFAKDKTKVVKKTGVFGTCEANGSAAMAAATLAMSAAVNRPDGSVSGVVQIDSQTSLPYTVLDYTIAAQSMRSQGQEKPYFNLVVCNDIFDTHERYKIFFRPMTERYPGLQVLLWNYPGQAFSEYRQDVCLNNEYLATCMDQLLRHVGPEGTKEFNTKKPFYLMGFGNGANVATYYTGFYKNPSIRSLVLVNGYSYIDPNIAAILHDCMNVFSCSPPSRPDLPVYFYSRFLFSPQYLAKVSTPLALNIYTAVFNPITIQGRIQLCNGVLDNIDLRPLIKDIHYPVIALQATASAISRPHHVEPFSARRNGEAKSIHRALNDFDKLHIIWVKAGHEVFQELRQPIQTLFEQLCIGFHEKHDLAFLPSVSSNPDYNLSDVMGDHGDSTANKKKPSRPGPMNTFFEDKFIDGVLDTMQGKPPKGRVVNSAGSGGQGSRTSTGGHLGHEEGIDHKVGSPGRYHGSAPRPETAASKVSPEQRAAGETAWQDYRKEKYRAGQVPGDGGKMMTAVEEMEAIREEKRRREMDMPDQLPILNPDAPAFERQGNAVYEVGKGSLVYPDPMQFPEAKEYMRWRLKRNRKRFQRLDRAARIIQGAYRGHLARLVVHALRSSKAALTIQRMYRGYRGRLRFLERLRMIWAAQLVQRTYRTHAARILLVELRRRRVAIIHIQRIMRGKLGRNYVKRLKEQRRLAATALQSTWRAYAARKLAFRRRHERNAAIQIQRVFRGHLGRRRATMEKDKYIFSKSQSQGIEFGRQMLLEHKLHATRLQSEVSILNREKMNVEEQTEALLEEISEFEEAVNTLEKEMHQLSKIETEALGVLDETTRLELREQKMRLDSEFGEMLGKIADRKERLQIMEKKLAELDRQRQAKEEELRGLERKLVVLLEEQQRELDAIRKRQQKKGELLIKTQEALAAGDLDAIVPVGGEGAGGYVGPSVKEKKQAAQLMQSTETLMKFGFMSMSMTYFSSLNLIRAMRTVAAQDTIMAALAANTAQGMSKGGSGDGKGGDLTLHEVEDKYGRDSFKPSLKPGQMPGQETLRVNAWSVDDVARWLQTLCLGQYREAFVDAAIDGSFLYDLNEDDLKNSLGIEHRLHRKKILASIGRLKNAEAERERQYLLKQISKEQLVAPLAAAGMMGTTVVTPAMIPTMGGVTMPTTTIAPAAAVAAATMAGSTTITMAPVGSGEVPQPNAPRLDLTELISWVRHSKNGKIKAALDSLPTRKFDPSLIKVQYVEDFGTAYLDAYEREPFNVNKVDEFGNTLLHIACQNGNDKVARLLIMKGANPNHQNKQGNTPGHYAVGYHFYDLATWLFDGEGGGGNDTIENKWALTPYDGLAVDNGEEEEGGPKLLGN